MEKMTEVFEICTPIVLFCWFLYIRKEKFYKQLTGIYSGYTPRRTLNGNQEAEGGIVMKVADIDSGGFFRGQFDFRENISINDRTLHDGFYSFYGKIGYRLTFPRGRNPLDSKGNRTYVGKMYIVDRLDINYKNQTIDQFLQAEYDVVYLREMKVLEFTLRKKTDRLPLNVPGHFVIYKTLGVTFEPYQTVKNTIFRGMTTVDKG